MKRLIGLIVAPAVILSTLIIPSSITSACTGITIKPKDGSAIFGRTLEFAQDLQSNIIIVPRQRENVGSTPNQQPGLHWTSQYGMVGMNAFDLPMIVDGINEKGLHVGIFYFPGYAEYQDLTAQDTNKSISPVEVPLYLLGTCQTVDDIAEALKKVKVSKVVLPQLGGVPPFHYIVNDASGKSIVLEYIKGKLNIYQNPLGVLTNAPTFEWQMTNLNNYVNLLANTTDAIKIEGVTIKGFGLGSGMHGLPGDFTPPSRFVRAVAFSSTAFPVQTAREGVLQTFHILNQFDIPKGSARKVEQGKVVGDYTMWTAVSDLKNLHYYFRTYEDSTIKMINLNCIDLNAAGIKTISIQGDQPILDLSGCAR